MLLVVIVLVVIIVLLGRSRAAKTRDYRRLSGVRVRRLRAIRHSRSNNTRHRRNSARMSRRLLLLLRGQIRTRAQPRGLDRVLRLRQSNRVADALLALRRERLEEVIGDLLAAGRRQRGGNLGHVLLRVREEGQRRQPEVVPVGGGGGELEGALGREDEDGAGEGGWVAFWGRVVVFYVED